MEALVFAGKQEVEMGTDVQYDGGGGRCVWVVFDVDLRERVLELAERFEDRP